jgi:hypothetical protein
MAAVNKKGAWGFIDVNGREVIPLKYDFATPFDQGTAKVLKNNGKWYYIDRTGRETPAN